MRLALSAALISAIFACDLCAQAVVVNDDIQFTADHPEYGLKIRLSNSLRLRYEPGLFNVLPGRISLVFSTGLYPETQIFVVNPGDVFTESAIAAGEFPKVGTQTVAGGANGFYLGVAVFDTFSDDYIYQFGWVHLRPIPLMVNEIVSELEMVQNVMSYGTHGIIIGTTTIVPEPGIYALFLSSVAMCCCRRFRFGSSK